MTYNVLLSAYACRPNHGSEPEVGWSWATELARIGHRVTVITHSMNAAEIATHAPLGENLSFHYVDGLLWLERLTGDRAYYWFWQVFAALSAAALHRRHRFDVVHHVTYASIRVPSFMGLMGVRFILGPVSGGETIPASLRSQLPFRDRLFEWLRDLSNVLVKYDPLVRLCLASADRIFVTTPESFALVPVRYHPKCETLLAIGCQSAAARRASERNPTDPLRLLFAGRLIALKGAHLALKALALARTQGARCRLSIVGSGPEEARLRKLVAQYGIADVVDWFPRVPRRELSAIFDAHDVFLHPSLRDSGGMALLEALAAGLPAICLAVGGPKEIVDARCGIVSPVDGRSQPEIESDLAAAVCALAGDRERLRTLSRGAVERAKSFRWRDLVARVYGQE
jgi:glycosyltransferase involved in cell wall biosynthesis